MAVYNFSDLADGQAISFDPQADVLVFDQTSVSAAFLSVSPESGATRIEVFSKEVLLLDTVPRQLTTLNVTFADGSRLLFGDDSAGTAGDDGRNSLAGTAGRDLLQGLGGADTMAGGADDDVYVVDDFGDRVV